VLGARTQAGALTPNLSTYLDAHMLLKVALLAALNMRGDNTVKKCYELEKG